MTDWVWELGWVCVANKDKHNNIMDKDGEVRERWRGWRGGRRTEVIWVPLLKSVNQNNAPPRWPTHQSFVRYRAENQRTEKILIPSSSIIFGKNSYDNNITSWHHYIPYQTKTWWKKSSPSSNYWTMNQNELRWRFLALHRRQRRRTPATSFNPFTNN